MKIVILDAFTLNPGDLSWAELRKSGEVEIYDRTASHEIVERAKDAEAVLTNKTVLSKETINALPNLKYIGVMATGYNVVDIEVAKENGIVVTNAPAYSTPSTAQHAFALILELTNRVGVHSESVKNGDWVTANDFSYWKTPLMQLSGKTMGIIGFGKIGKEVAKIAMAFGLTIIVNHKHPERDKMDDVEFVSLEEVFTRADLISLHCPLTAENKGFVNETLLSKMKASAFLINTARGSLINERDLSKFLNEGLIAGAALDVLSVEPPTSDNPLLKSKNCLITPHIAWATKEARERLLQIVTENIKAFISGKPRNVIS